MELSHPQLPGICFFLEHRDMYDREGAGAQFGCIGKKKSLLESVMVNLNYQLDCI
jgi:hypothetical protein